MRLVAMIKNMVKVFFSNVSSLIISFITSIIIARILGPEGNGQLGVIILIPSTLYVIISGQYFGDSQYFTKKSIYSKEEMISSSLIIYGFLCAIQMLLVTGYHMISYVPNYIYIILMIVVLNLNLFIMPFLIAIDEIKAKNILTVMSSILNALQVIILVILLNNTVNVKQIAMTQIITFAVADAVGMYIIFSNIKGKLDFSLRKNFNIIKSVFGFVKSCYISNVANFLNFRIDQWFILGFGGNASLGLYSVAVNMAEKLWIIPDSIAAILYPGIAAMDNHKKVIKSINKIIFLGSVAGLLGWGLIFLILDKLIILIYKSEYLQVSQVIKILFPGIIMFSIGKIVTCFLSGVGRPDLRVKPSVIGTVSNLILNIFFVRKYGIEGAAFSTTISYTIYGVWTTLVYFKISKEYA